MEDASAQTVPVRYAGVARGWAILDGEAAFSRMRTAFGQAVATNPDRLLESYYTFAGQIVRIRIVGRELAEQIGRPFSHLRMNGSVSPAPQLTIDLWDVNETNIRLHVGPARPDLGWADATAVSPDGRFLGQRLPNTFTCLDRKAEHIIGSIAWSDDVFIYERGKPLTRPLVMWHNDRNVHVIHAGLVSRNEQGVLFAGRSGSGKSTSTLACLCAGFNYLSEDFVGLQRLKDGSFVGHSLYNSVFLETDDLARFPDLIPHAIKGRFPYEGKSLILLSQVFPKRLERSVPIKALALPRIVDSPRSRIRPASKGEALLAVGPSSLFMALSPEDCGFERLVQLVEHVPSYWLELGRDRSEIPRRVEELLAGATRS